VPETPGVGRQHVEQHDFGNVPTGSQRYAPAGDCSIVETCFVGVYRGSWRRVSVSLRRIDVPVALFAIFRRGQMACEQFYCVRETLLKEIGGNGCVVA
jgi:hypothetical protein